MKIPKENNVEIVVTLSDFMLSPGKTPFRNYEAVAACSLTNLEMRITTVYFHRCDEIDNFSYLSAIDTSSKLFVMKLMNGCCSVIIILCCLLTISCNNQPKQEETSRLIVQRQVIDSTVVHNPWAKIPGDLNSDGTIDIIIGGQKGPLVWFRNPDWEVFQISEGGYNTVDGECGDIDGDGDKDIVMGGLYWYENPGGLKDTPDQQWNTHVVADHPTHDIELADLNSDNRLDIISRDQSDFGTMRGNEIHVWYNLGNENWNEEILECDHGEGLRVADLDSDLDVDIVAAGFWFENRNNDWIKHIYTEWHPSANLAIADFNNDDRLDLVLTPSELKSNYYKISWFEQPSDLLNNDWIEHVIIDSIECVIHGVDVGDFNLDGKQDIAYSEMHQGEDPDEVVILINQEDGVSWEKVILSVNGSHSIEVADITGNGRPDVFGANWSGDYQPIELWENRVSSQ